MGIQLVKESLTDPIKEMTDIYQMKMEPDGAIWMAGHTTGSDVVRRPMVVRLAPWP